MPGIFIKLIFLIGFFLLFNLQNTEIYGEKLPVLHSPILINGTTTEILKWAEEVERDQGYDAAVELYTQLIHYFEIKFGAQHANSMALLIRLCRIYLKEGKHEKALPLVWKIYRQREKDHGKEDLQTVDALTELGKIYLLNRKYQKAEELLKRAYRLTKSQLGQNHKETLLVLFSLANVYRHSGDPETLDLALRYYKKVYDVRSNDPELGQEHEVTIDAFICLGDVLAMQGKYEEAVEIFQKVLEIRTRTLGEGHPSTQEVKRLLFVTLSDSGKTGKARKLLMTEEQTEEEEDQSLFTLVEGKAAALAEMGKHAQALEILTELYDHESLKRHLSPKIFKVLDKLVSYSRKQGDFDQILKWASVVIKLIQNQFKNQKVSNEVKVKVEVTSKDKKDREKIILAQLNAIESFIFVYSEQNDEDKIDEYFQTASEVIKGQGQGHEQSIALVEKFLAITKRIVNFKTGIGKTTEAFNILNYFVDHHPRECTTSVCGISLMVDIAMSNDDYKMVENIALKFFSNKQEPEKNVDKKQPIREFLVEYLWNKAHDLFDLKKYAEAFSLYKTVEKIWTENQLSLDFLERISNAALMLKKFDEVLFYQGKIKDMLEKRLTDEPNMNEKERAGIFRDIAKLDGRQVSPQTPGG